MTEEEDKPQPEQAVIEAIPPNVNHGLNPIPLDEYLEHLRKTHAAEKREKKTP